VVTGDTTLNLVVNADSKVNLTVNLTVTTDNALIQEADTAVNLVVNSGAGVNISVTDVAADQAALTAAEAFEAAAISTG
jgi:hypothetical protein